MRRFRFGFTLGLQTRGEPANQAMLPQAHAILEVCNGLRCSGCCRNCLNMGPARLLAKGHRHESKQRKERDSTENGATPETEQHSPRVVEATRAGQNDDKPGSHAEEPSAFRLTTMSDHENARKLTQPGEFHAFVA